MMFALLDIPFTDRLIRLLYLIRLNKNSIMANNQLLIEIDFDPIRRHCVVLQITEYHSNIVYVRIAIKNRALFLFVLR